MTEAFFEAYAIFVGVGVLAVLIGLVTMFVMEIRNN